MNTTTTQINETFRQDVLNGLTDFPKHLPSKYIYDRAGDKLFQEIMAMPEYYLTNCELEILSTHTAAIASKFVNDGSAFDLIELGAGDGMKTKVLLKYLADSHIDFVYKPIDISENAVASLAQNLAKELPEVRVIAETGEYFEVLEELQQLHSRRKVILLLGSNIGNLLHPRAIEFLSRLEGCMNENDRLFIGFDQKKDPQLILDAYNDPKGITSAFNKNLLHRINNELGGNFDTDLFKHWEVYDPETGTAKSYLVSTAQQTVTIDALELDLEFDAWETIHVEISQKYDDTIVAWLANESGLQIDASFVDSKNYYKNYIFSKKNSTITN